MGRARGQSLTAVAVSPGALRRAPVTALPVLETCMLRETFEGLTAGGLTLAAAKSDDVRVSSTGQTVTFDGEVTVNGEWVGNVGVLFTDEHEEDERVAVLAYIQLEPSARGRGFGTAVESALARSAQAAGASSVQLRASDEGSYTWARAGYDFLEPEGAPQAIVDSSRMKLLHLRHQGHITDEVITQLRDDLMNGKLRTPQAFAAYRQEHPWAAYDGKHTWLGRELLRGNHWDGIKRLPSQ